MIFFFFKQKTAYEMRISDWSSDVCSSDLALDEPGDAVEVGDLLADQARGDELVDRRDDRAMGVAGDHRRGRRLAVADVAGVGVDADDDVLDRLHRAQSGLERRFQRNPQHAEADVGDLHWLALSDGCRCQGRIRWMLVMRST